MLIEFTCGNYRSLKDDATLSMVATKLRSRRPEVETGTRTRISEKLHVLNSAILFGANASGKTNFVRAFQFFVDFVRNSAREGQSGDAIPVTPFLLHQDTAQQPSYFEIVFRHDGLQYRYGFEVDDTEVVREWLFRKKKREVELLRRADEQFEKVHRDFADGELVKRRTRKNALFLSVAAQLDVPLASNILEWFKKAGFISGLSDSTAGYTAGCIRNDTFGPRTKELVRQFDTGIRDISIRELDIKELELPDELLRSAERLSKKGDLVQIRTIHPVYDEDGNEVGEIEFDLGSEESHGTRKLFAIAGPILDILERGGLVILDEFDARLHPLICREIINLFHDPATNPRGAQLIAVTHDPSLLSRDIFRRDQIWFTEKDDHGATSLYSLASFRVRNDASFESDYVLGRYGAIPFLGGLRGFFVNLAGEGDTFGNTDEI